MFDYEPYRELLKKKSITQSELIDKGIINRQNAHKLKNNKSLTIETIDKICNKLHCNFSDIVRHYEE